LSHEKLILSQHRNKTRFVALQHAVWLPSRLKACEVMVYQVKGACIDDDKKQKDRGCLVAMFC
jgi:hypothetical protein